MSPGVMTLEALASPVEIGDLVGRWRRRTRRWSNASQVLRRSDDLSIAGWFTAHSWQERIQLVREALVQAAPWAPLLRVLVPKRVGSTETRPIDMPTVLDATRVYRLHDWLQPHAETVLTPVAVAFRPGRAFSDTVLNAHREMATRPFAAVLDIRAFYDAISWRLLDDLIARLPAEERLQELLRALVRAEVVERGSGVLVPRTAGIAQGLSVSPVLANLVLAEFDRIVAAVTGKVGARIRRYCDDMLVLAPNLAALEHSVSVVRDRLAQLGFQVKDATGQLLDTRETPVLWLGLDLTPTAIDVPGSVIERKTQELQARYDLGILSEGGIEDSLAHRHRHYSRILGAERADHVDAAIRGGLLLGAHPMRRKEGIERLRELVTER